MRNNNNTISNFTYPSIDILKTIIYTTILVPFLLLLLFFYLICLFIYTFFFFLRKIKDNNTC